MSLPTVFGDSECGCEGTGVLVMWNDPDRPHIERCDTCGVFPTDADAAELVQVLLTRAAMEIGRMGRVVLTHGEMSQHRRHDDHADH